MKIGLTGGLGAGKSTVAALLAARGAVVVDADALAREVVRRGTPGFRAVVQRFGDGILGPDGELDRPRLGRLVFSDPDALADLNAIVHPLVSGRSRELLESAPAGAVVVYDVPLLAENGLAGDFDIVVVVEADLTTRLCRLRRRGLSDDDARARITAQASDEQRRAVADEVVDNAGSRADLERRVDALWRRLSGAGGP